MTKTMKARFSTRCPACGDQVQVGEDIRRHKGTGRYGHASCGSKSTSRPRSRQRRESDAWRQEMAMEQGMAHGAEAYNDAMGWGRGY